LLQVHKMLGPAASAFMAMILVFYPYGSCAAHLILVGEHCLLLLVVVFMALMVLLLLRVPAALLPLLPTSTRSPAPAPSAAAGDSFQPLLLQFFAPAWWNCRAAVISTVGCACILPLCFRTRLGALRGGALSAGQQGATERHPPAALNLHVPCASGRSHPS
jgi:sodium-coupled neutral amino acid transporter 7/8